jgi:hypothetical protein
VHFDAVRPRKDKRGVDLISDALPFGVLWYTKVDHAVGYAQFYSRSQSTLIRVYADVATWSKRTSTQASSRSRDSFFETRNYVLDESPRFFLRSI